MFSSYNSCVEFWLVSKDWLLWFLLSVIIKSSLFTHFINNNVVRSHHNLFVGIGVWIRNVKVLIPSFNNVNYDYNQNLWIYNSTLNF